MKILIVYAHPNQKSYTFQILEYLRQELMCQKWNVEVSDLYAINFQSDMTAQEYEREGLANRELALADDVLVEHQKIEEADAIIFLYPVWWSDCPAKLKGWFDRVYAHGYAYGHRDNFKKIKAIKVGAVICTAGHPNEFLTEIGIAKSMENIMLDDRLGKRFEHKEMIILGGTLQIDQVKALHQQKLQALIQKIAAYCR